MFNVQLEPTLVKPLTGRSRGVLSGVTTGGATLALIVTKFAEITQLQVNHVTGSGTFTVDIYSDVTRTDKIFSAVSDETDSLYLSGLHLQFENTNSPQENLCYVTVTPATGISHDFKVAVFFNKH